MLWGIRPLEAQATHGIAVDRLRNQIHSGLLLPEDKLPAERALAETLGISRVTLREALRVLEEAGYIAIRRGAHGGAFVADENILRGMAQRRIARDPAAAMRVMEFRAANEMACARFAATRRLLPDLKRMRAACAALSDLGTQPAAAKQQSTSFLFAMAEASHNPLLANAVADGVAQAFEPMHGDEARARLFSALLETIERQDEAAAMSSMAAIHARAWELLRRWASGGRDGLSNGA
jgi:GntR family transcriptional regulator, transcriptional repressor for pyruvate dehydrogenase complex